MSKDGGAAQPPKPAGAAGEKEKKGGGGLALLSKGANGVATVIVLYAVYVGNIFRGILYPQFPEMDPTTHNYIPKFNCEVQPGDEMMLRLSVSHGKEKGVPITIAELKFPYNQEGFKPFSSKLQVNVTGQQLAKGQNVMLTARVSHLKSGKSVKADGPLVKKMKAPEIRPKYQLLSGQVCPEEEGISAEPSFGRGRSHVARGMPQMQVRLVYDTMAYPYPWAKKPYMPPVFVDEFWMTDDQLIKLNVSGNSSYDSEVTFGFMSAARWRFQRHMEFSFEQNAKLFGEDSEEMLQVRDLFANTNSYLLATTLIVSVLHIIFEFLAFKNDVIFFQSCDPELLNKYTSIGSIAVGIVFQILLLMYLMDESANLLVLITSLVAIFVDVWKVWRAMKLTTRRLFGMVPVPWLQPRTQKREKVDDFDSVAMRWLAMAMLPCVFCYSGYTLVQDCHRGWYSYFLTTAASCVYSLGFVLMTPQVFINYKYKSVAFLPWRRFIYRALNTFIDDLFAMIIRMPTMHRLSCFRDDIVFVIYLYQRWLYPVDKDRAFDEDGYAIDADPSAEGAGAAEAKPVGKAKPEGKKSR